MRFAISIVILVAATMLAPNALAIREGREPRTDEPWARAVCLIMRPDSGNEADCHYTTVGSGSQVMNGFGNGILIPPDENGDWWVLSARHIFNNRGVFKVRFKVYDENHPCGGHSRDCTNCSTEEGNASEEGPFWDVLTTDDQPGNTEFIRTSR
jgi:hypothetical protein